MKSETFDHEYPTFREQRFFHDLDGDEQTFQEKREKECFFPLFFCFPFLITKTDPSRRMQPK